MLLKYSKDFFEKLFAIIVFVLLFPLLILIAVAIKIDSQGPVIFSQYRMGKGRKRYVFYKFRTMYEDARRRYPSLYKYEYTRSEIKRMKFKIEDDPRLTPFGKYIRKTSLDELPNLINVIKGDMSLVGPRPEIPEMLRYYSKEQLIKFSIKPGVTGLAQVSGRGLLTFQETINLDILYVREKSIKTDINISLKTIIVVLKAVGAF